MDLPKWAPSTKQVANHILSRTRLPNGEDAGDFTSETKPTDSQVQETIEKVVAGLIPRLGEVPERLEGQACALASLKCAYKVELSYFTEQAESGMSPYRSLLMEYKEELCNWDMAAKGEQPNSQTVVHSVRVSTEYPGYSIGTL